jgi:hypothetical protein
VQNPVTNFPDNTILLISHTSYALFSLEEMSSYFPLKTLWRSYFCALVATAVLAVSWHLDFWNLCRGLWLSTGNEPLPDGSAGHVPGQV